MIDLYKTIIEVDLSNANRNAVYNSIRQDIKNNTNSEVEMGEDNILKIIVSEKDITSLIAKTNTVLNLIKVAEKIMHR